MFFGNSKVKDEEIAKLKLEVANLMAQTEQKEKEVSRLQSELLTINKSELELLTLENKQMKQIASLSQEEGLVAFKKDGTILFSNDRAKENIKSSF